MRKKLFFSLLFIGILSLSGVIYVGAETIGATNPSPADTTEKSVDSSNLTLSWSDNVSAQTECEASTYDLFVDNNSGVGSPLITEIGLTTNSKQISGLEKAKFYYWRVDVHDSCGNIYTGPIWKFLTAVGQPPVAPTNLKAEIFSGKYVKLTWKDNSTAETGFKMERKEGLSGSYLYKYALDKNITTLVDEEVGQGKTYYYRVRAYGQTTEEYGDSDYSNEVSITIPTEVSIAPDLIVSGISSEPTTPKSGEKFIIYVTIKNIGDGEVATDNISFSVNNPDGSSIERPLSFEVSGTYFSSQNTAIYKISNWVVARGGTIIVRASVSCPDDADATNNELTKDIIVAENYDSLPPSLPIGIKVFGDQAYDKPNIYLSWINPPQDDFTTIKIYKSSKSGELGALIKTYQDRRPSAGDSWRDMDISWNTIYYYTLRSVDTLGNESGNSDQYSATCNSNVVSPKPEPKPTVCTTEYDPVCGKDGKTYSNKCNLEKDGVELDYYGKCQTTQCRVQATCPGGYYPKNTGEKDSSGCPIMKCISRDGTSEIEILKQEILDLKKEIIRIKQEFLNREKNLVQKIDEALTRRLKGKILLQVEEKGEAWYVSPTDEKKHYLGRPNDAFDIMRQLGLGITNANLEQIDIGITSQEGLKDSDGDGLSDALEEGLGTNKNYNDSDNDGYTDYDEVIKGYNPQGAGKKAVDTGLVNRTKGRILLQVEEQGQAWYLNPADNKRYYLGRPSDAFDIMRGKGLGITNDNLRKIEVGEVD